MAQSNEIGTVRPNETARDRKGGAGQPAESPKVVTEQRLAELLGEREANLRQVILRAHRSMNKQISMKFGERGYPEIRPEHLTLLANINLGQTSVVELADRAQMTESGMNELAGDLDRLGYVKQSNDPLGPVIMFTDAGWELMLTSFNIQREIEAECRERVRGDDLSQLRRILTSIFHSN